MGAMAEPIVGWRDVDVTERLIKGDQLWWMGRWEPIPAAWHGRTIRKIQLEMRPFRRRLEWRDG